MDQQIKILGAGLSGLSAAINLKLAGKDVDVYELRNSVGEQIQPNFQLLHSREKSVSDYLKDLNLSPKFEYLEFSKAFFLTRKRDIEINLKRPLTFVCRGGNRSLEYGLYQEALNLGVKFEFNTKISEKNVNIVATGPKGADACGFGYVYEDLDFPRDHFLMMYDDRYSPRGWYFYIVPHLENKFEVINCVCQPYTPLVKKLFSKAIEERKMIRDIVGNKKPVHSISGIGNVDIPRTAVIENRFYLGESAGFQDPFRGFGMNFALESGKLATEAIIKNLDYDKLWKQQFMDQFKLDFSRRLAISIFGDRLVEFLYRNVNSGDTMDFVKGDVSGTTGKVLKDLFFNLELFKHKLLGYW